MSFSNFSQAKPAKKKESGIICSEDYDADFDLGTKRHIVVAVSKGRQHGSWRRNMQGGD